jgi:hypothetical protein
VAHLGGAAALPEAARCLHDPDLGAVRKRSRADRLGAGGARSFSRLPERRAALFAQEESSRAGDRTSALPRMRSHAPTGPDECKGDLALVRSGRRHHLGGLVLSKSTAFIRTLGITGKRELDAQFGLLGVRLAGPRQPARGGWSSGSPPGTSAYASLRFCTTAADPAPQRLLRRRPARADQSPHESRAA